LFEKRIILSKVALKKLELINGEQIDKGSILDIGAGTGDFIRGKRRLEYYRN
jgi:ubiquinone/menaquinone biosynthesis C-methylase UbiE